MNDTLRYMMEDPSTANITTTKVTFGMMYQYSENFVPPLSHDEVVHGKRSLPDGCLVTAGSNLLTYAPTTALCTASLAKTLFMGSEFAQGRGWNYNEGTGLVPAGARGGGWHKGVQDFVRELEPCL